MWLHSSCLEVSSAGLCSDLEAICIKTTQKKGSVKEMPCHRAHRNFGGLLREDSPVGCCLHTPALLYLHVLCQASWLHGDNMLIGAQFPSNHFLIVKFKLDSRSWRHIHFGFEVFHIQGVAPEKLAVELFWENTRRKKAFLCFGLELCIWWIQF